ncbi:hypothetical protein HS041_22430 [Planomonospora sp. ID67723]|uniref:DUF732 domain-containing protein n=1 Tax=Planomonospora sp. ID67723 TaxID=2738134 RepID=UPI0018C39376|nr:DUF732 domain-containing protein [Planomonospora sp. ID67723]MBG0830522.1 hypothetical protein [Planomonospora sp. ID67723]
MVLIGVVLVLALLGGLVKLVDGGEHEQEGAGPAVSSTVPSPDADQRAFYLAALRSINPGLVMHEERAIRRGRAVCERILRGDEGTTLNIYVVQALSGGDAVIDQGQADQVVTAVKAWCR